MFIKIAVSSWREPDSDSLQSVNKTELLVKVDLPKFFPTSGHGTSWQLSTSVFSRTSTTAHSQ